MAVVSLWRTVSVLLDLARGLFGQWLFLSFFLLNSRKGWIVPCYMKFSLLSSVNVKYN